MGTFGLFPALILSINSSIFLCLVNVTQANCALTTNFWTSGYAKGCLIPAHAATGAAGLYRAGVGQATKEETAGGNVTFR